eukprot:9255025-Ditylum_brightwellii.AAC.1
MPLSDEDFKTWFTGPNGLAVPETTFNHLQAHEEIATIKDLVDFDKDTLSQMASNHHCPVVAPDGG